MRVYELVLILKPQLADAEIAEFLDKTKKFIAHEGGELLSEDKWGRRKLAQPIGHTRDGFYSYMKFQLPPQSLTKLNQYFKVQEAVMRTLVVKGAEKEAAKVPARVPVKQV